MATRRDDSAATVVRLGLAGCIALLVLQSAADLTAALGFHSYDSLLDLDRNNGLPDLVSTLVILAGALGAGALGYRSERVRVQSAALAVILALVAFDDTLHEEIDLDRTVGVAVFATLGLAALLTLDVALRSPRRARISLLVGVSTLAVAIQAAFGYDEFLNMIGYGDLVRGDALYEIGIVLKQGLELGGWSLIAIGLWAAAMSAPETMQRGWRQRADSEIGS